MIIACGIDCNLVLFVSRSCRQDLSLAQRKETQEEENVCGAEYAESHVERGRGVQPAQRVPQRLDGGHYCGE